MSELSRNWLVRALRVPPEPHPPAGSPGSLQIFRAADNFFFYLLVQWAFKQMGAFLGVLFVLTTGLPFNLLTPVFAGLNQRLSEAPSQWIWLKGVTNPTAVEKLLFGFELLVVVFLIFQAIVSFLLLRLDWKLRWYLVTDRSLRIREGIRRVREMTLTFANVQNLQIQQGPIERILGISNLQVTTAGGGGSSTPGSGM